MSDTQDIYLDPTVSCMSVVDSAAIISSKFRPGVTHGVNYREFFLANHQDVNLILKDVYADMLAIADDIFDGALPRRGPLLDLHRVSEFLEIFASSCIGVPPDQNPLDSHIAFRELMLHYYLDEVRDACRKNFFELKTSGEADGKFYFYPVAAKKRHRDDSDDELELPSKIIDSKASDGSSDEETQEKTVPSSSANSQSTIIPEPQETLNLMTASSVTQTNKELNKNKPNKNLIKDKTTPKTQSEISGKTNKNTVIIPNSQNQAATSTTLSQAEQQIIDNIDMGEIDTEAPSNVDGDPFNITFFCEIKTNYRETFAKLREATKLTPPPTIELKGELFKITTINIGQFRAVQKYLKDNDVPFQTLDPIEERPKKYLLRGIPTCTPPDEVIEFLRTKGIHALSAVYLRDRRTKAAMPLFMATCKPTPSLSKIMEITDFNYLKITVTEFKPPPVKQCYRCEGYGHHSFTCTLAYNCARCAGSHPTHQCNSEVTKCCNCGGEHTATWRGCPANPLNRRKNKKAVPLNAKKSQANFPPPTRNNTSQAKFANLKNQQNYTPAPIPTQNRWHALATIIDEINKQKANQDVNSNATEMEISTTPETVHTQSEVEKQNNPLKVKIPTTKNALLEIISDDEELRKRPSRPNQRTRKNLKKKAISRDPSAQNLPKQIILQNFQADQATGQSTSSMPKEQRKPTAGIPEQVLPLRAQNSAPTNQEQAPTTAPPTEPIGDQGLISLINILCETFNLKKYLDLILEIINIFKSKPFVNAVFEVLLKLNSYWNSTALHGQ